MTDTSFELRVAKKFLALSQSSKSRGLEFDLSLTSLRNIYKAKKCYYTGVNLVQAAGKCNSVTIDRVDASRGYVKGNVVACSSSFNQKKKDLTTRDITTLYKKIKHRVDI